MQTQMCQSTVTNGNICDAGAVVGTRNSRVPRHRLTYRRFRHSFTTPFMDEPVRTITGEEETVNESNLTVVATFAKQSSLCNIRKSLMADNVLTPR